MGFRAKLRYGVASCAGLLLFWALYDYGAFLGSSRLVVAIAFPVLGLLWMALHALAASAHGTAGCARILRCRSLGEWSLLALAALGALSAAWSIDPAASLQSAGILLGGLFFLVLGARLGGSGWSERFVTLLALVAVGSVISLVAIVGYGLQHWPFAMRHDGTLLATGTLGYANALAGLLLLTIAVTAALFLEIRNRHPGPVSGVPGLAQLLLVVAALLQMAALVLTRSRAAAVILPVLVVLTLIMWSLGVVEGSRRHFRVGIALSALLLCGLIAAGVLVWKEVAPQMAVSGLPPAGADPEDIVPMTSNSFRIKTWAAALEAARERPLAGYGLGTFYEAYSPFKQGGHTAYAHNVVLQHLVETGALGALIVLAFLAAAVVRPIKILFGPATDPRMPLLLGALSFALHNLVDLTWYFPVLLFIFTLLLGLMRSRPLDRHPHQVEQPAESPRR